MMTMLHSVWSGGGSAAGRRKSALALGALLALLASVLIWTAPAQAQNQSPPVAIATYSVSTDANTGVQTATLRGGASFDPGGSITVYKWEVVTETYSWLTLTPTAADSNEDVTFTVPNAALAARYGLSIDFRLTVTDNGGASAASASTTITFNLNQTPTADISVSANLEDRSSTETGVDRYTVDAVIDGPGENGNADNEWDIRENALLVLDGSGSSDANGTIKSYAWSRLYVTDDNETFGLPGASGTAKTHSTDDANTANTVETLENLPADDSANSPYYAYYTLTVTDNDDTPSQPAIVKLVIHDQPATPVASLFATTDTDVAAAKAKLTDSDAANNAEAYGSLQQSTFPSDTPRFVVSPDTTINLDADATDADGGNISYAWTGAKQDSDSAKTDQAALKVEDGTEDGTVLTVTVAATDNTGLTGTASIEFLVVDGNNRPTAATGARVDGQVGRDGGRLQNLPRHDTDDGAKGGDDGADGNPSGRITFRGVGFDRDQSASSLIYSWTELTTVQGDVADPTVVLSDGNPFAPVDPDEAVLELEDANTDTVSFAVPEVTTGESVRVPLSFTVVDQYGVSASAVIVVKITGVDSAPVADAGPTGADAIVDPGEFVRLTGAGSSDPDKGDKIGSYSWTLTGVSTTPATTEVRKSVADQVLEDLKDYIAQDTDNDGDLEYPQVLTNPTDAYPYFYAPKVATGIANVQLTFTLEVTDSVGTADTDSDSDSVIITVANNFYDGDITGPNFCTNSSFGGPSTYAFDSTGDGIADTCSLRTTRRATVARQNALNTLVALDSTIEVAGLDASKNPAKSHASFEVLMLGRDGVDADTSTTPTTPAVASVDATCDSAPKNLGDSEADLAADDCSTKNVSDPPPPVDPAKAAEFFSGTITGPDYCTNLSLGGPRTYAFDSDGDGVADVCSLPYTRREAVARQNALEKLDQHPQYAAALANACAALGTTDFGDGEAALATDECNPEVAQPARGSALPTPTPTG